MLAMIKFAVLEDHDLMRESIESLLKRAFEKSTIKSYRNAKELLEDYNSTLFDIILLDLSLPEINGFKCIKEIKTKNYNQNIIVYTAYTDLESIQKCIRAGCSTVISKADEIEDLITSIHQVKQTNKFESKWIKQALHSPEQDLGYIELYEHEIEFLRLACSDYTYDEIAKQMNKSPKTIDFYRARIFAKTKIKSRSGLVKFAIQYFFWQKQEWIN